MLYEQQVILKNIKVSNVIKSFHDKDYKLAENDLFDCRLDQTADARF